MDCFCGPKIDCAKELVPPAEFEAALSIETSIIRDKITGSANDALISNSIACEWK